MDENTRLELIRQAMGASHVFCSTVNEFLEHALEEVTDEPLAMSQVKLLLLIARPEQSFKVTDVAQFLGVTNAAASRAIDRLVQRDLVDRTVSPEDRRAVRLGLTKRGERLLAEFETVRRARLLDLLEDYPDDDLRQVTVLLDRLSVRLLSPEEEGGQRCLRCGIHFRRGCVLRDVLGRECVVASGLYGPEKEEA
ncbi:MAG: MarR family transcriptional regulator [Gemmatimonadota bacterium]|jgi:DNA-binding MarR family transcriptional regulator